MATAPLAAAPVLAAAASTSPGEGIAFWILAVLAVGGAIGMIASRKAVHSALWIALTMVTLAVVYLINAAPFLGLVQIIVYTGAVMMLFLFVLMLIGVDASDSLVETIRGQRVAAVLVGAGFGVLLIAGFGNVAFSRTVGLDQVTTDAGGNLQAIAAAIFGRYVFAFEATSALLITAAVGAIVYTHRERLIPKPSQADLAQARFASATAPRAPLPAPGVLAQRNAIDVPGLLPDGSPAAESVPAAFRAIDDGPVATADSSGPAALTADHGESR
ncbi:MAG TPA: NADH-quinone oxidoreductase subunit J [Actinobacteria bacterium]|nr:NADH-quinone oxidoreductase subunit J [Actinomycetota bacterium]